MHISKDLILAHVKDQTVGVTGEQLRPIRDWPLRKLAESWRDEKFEMTLIALCFLAVMTSKWWLPEVLAAFF